jgi:hypothetical protein
MRGFSTSPDVANAPEGWVVEYGPMSIDCRDEEDAKRIVPEFAPSQGSGGRRNGRRSITPKMV